MTSGEEVMALLMACFVSCLVGSVAGEYAYAAIRYRLARRRFQRSARGGEVRLVEDLGRRDG